MKSKENTKLSSKQLQALPILLSSASYEEAAQKLGISAKQIYVWLKNSLFQQELTRLRNEAFSEALRGLKSGAKKAVSTLVGSLEDPSPRIRLAAADKILSNAFQAMDVCDMEDRLIQIEKRVDQALKKEKIFKRSAS